MAHPHPRGAGEGADPLTRRRAGGTHGGEAGTNPYALAGVETISSGRTISAKWQADGWPCPRSISAGSSSAQMSWAFQQRVRNRQPDGGFAGLGTSPSSTIRSRPRWPGSGTGTADRSAWVYGCAGVS